MDSGPRLTERSLLLGFAALIACFLASTVYSEYYSAGITRQARSMADNALPSIERLTRARAELRRLEVLAERHAQASPEHPAKKEDVLACRGRLAQELDAYRALPDYPGERALWPGVARGLAGVDRALSSLLGAGAPGGRRAANAAIEPLDQDIETTDDALRGLVALNVGQAYRVTGEVASTREHVLRAALALDAGSIVLSALAAVAALRVVRRYTGFLKARSRHFEQRADELELFAGRVAHDILNPLNTAGLALRLAERHCGGSAKAGEALGRGRSALGRIERIIRDLLAFAKAGAQPEPGASAEARAVLEEVAAELGGLAAAAGAELLVEPGGPGPCLVACSPALLGVLLSNLLHNAIKYIGDGPLRRITVRLAGPGHRVRFEVEDTGPGVPEGLRETIFQPYVRAHGSAQPGIGLGLATVKRIVQAHGGAVGVGPSARGQGSLFWFELPPAPEVQAG